MVCSNETLKMSIDNLNAVVAENTSEQRETRSSLDKLGATFKTWQETKCGQHETKIFNLEKKAEKTEAKMNKWGGAIALVLFLMQAAGLLFTYLRIAPALAGG